MVITLPQDHKKNFYRLREVANRLRPPTGAGGSDARSSYGFCLLLFYSLESGCKYLLSRDHNIPSQHETGADPENKEKVECVEGYGHALDRMAQRLRVPAVYAPKIGNSFRLSGGHLVKNAKQNFSIAASHEAWRYGLVVEPHDQGILEVCLSKLDEWVQAQIEKA